MSMTAAQYPPVTPSGRSSSPPSSSPLLSSPLNPSYRQHNPPSQRRPSMKSDYQTRSRYIRFPLIRGQGSFPGHGTSAEAEHPQKALWREKLRQQFLQRAQNDRHKYREAKRSSSVQQFRDNSIYGADEMDTDEMEPSDYELYRIMRINEKRREDHAYRAQFARTVGSSLDPDMENFEEIEQFLAGPSLNEAGPSSPPTGAFDSIPSEFGIDEVLFDDVDPMDVTMDLSSPPTSPPSEDHLLLNEADVSFQSLILDCSCPFCEAPYALHFHKHVEKSNFECAVCNNSFLLGDALSSWDSMHLNSLPAHKPILLVNSALAEGVVVLCSDDLCQWGYAFPT